MSLKPVIVDVSDLWINTDKSLLKETADVGDGSIAVYNIADFAINKIIQIGEFGEEGTEIIKTHASTAPLVNDVTLASNLLQDHAKDTPVYIIPYDQIEISHADTETGAKSVLVLKNINPTNPEIRYEDTANTAGYYFTRYKESIGSTFSAYSDAIPYAGYAMNTVGYLIHGVMTEMGKDYGDNLTYGTLIRKVNACLNFVRGKLKRWSNYQEFDYIIDQINRGEYGFDLPDTYYDKNSNKSCLSVRIGSNEALTYRDKREFIELMEDIDVTTVSTQGEISDTSLILTSTADLSDEDGTVDVFIDNTKYTLTYTTNTKSTNTLSGIPATGDGSIAVVLPINTNVWYNESEEVPSYFSIWGGKLYIGGLIDTTNAGKNIYMDFYTDIVQVDSDTDILTGVRYDMVEYWLKWEIRNISENDSKRDYNDGDYVMFMTILQDAIRRESSGQKFKRKIKVSGISYHSEDELDFERS